MLYETLQQAYIFFGMLYFGIIAGLIYELKTTVNAPFKNNKAVTVILDIVFCLFLGVIFLIAVNFTNYGEIRLFIIISFAIGYILERISLGSVVAKLLNILYTITSKVIKKIKLPAFLKEKKEKSSERKQSKTIS